jgi:alkylation response protein AidB-like acyl-CoA dehydrogenase
MNIRDNLEEQEFRERARAWLKANGPTADEAKAMSPLAPDLKQAVLLAKQWQAKKASAGWAAPWWPREFGGQSTSPILQAIWDEEVAKCTAPAGIGLRHWFEVGFAVCAPTILAHGTPSQKARHLPKLLSGEEVWCQLFSEPEAGSDLANLRTSAVRNGGDWVVNGGKIWTTLAHIADYGLLVVRTNPDVPKHKGLTFFLLPMKTLGVTIKPIKQMTGYSGFNEVLFDNVRIPDANRLGAVDGGWQVIITTLSNERLNVGDGRPPAFDELFALARAANIDGEPAIRNSHIRQRLADSYVLSRGLRYIKYRALTALSQSRPLGPEVSISKLLSANNMQSAAVLGMELLEGAGELATPAEAPWASMFHDAFLMAPGPRLASGTDEILRNIIAERVLGMPGEIRSDKGGAFKVNPKSADPSVAAELSSK